MFENLTSAARAAPCSAKMKARALLTPHGFGSGANNFVNEILLAMRSKKSIAVCSPKDVETLWDGWFEDGGVPRCHKCHWTDRYNDGIVRQVMTDVYMGTHAITRRRIEEYKRFVHRTLFRPKKRLEDATDKVQEDLGLADHRFVGVHIRRGDKGGEAAPVSTSKYAKAVRKLCRHAVEECGTKVFLATDDEVAKRQLQEEFAKLGSAFKVVQQKRLPKVYYMMRNRDDNEKAEKNLAVDLQLLIRAYAFVGTASSNLGRFVYFSRGDSDTSLSVDDGGDFLRRPG